MSGYRVIDCDGHVAEPWEAYRDYADPEFRDRVPRRVDVEGHRFVVVDGTVYPNFVKYGGRPLGIAGPTKEFARPVQKQDLSEGGVDPHRRIKDMDLDGIEVAVCYPSGAGSMCAVPDPGLETALYRSYNRWLADYCAPYVARIKGVAVVSLRDVQRGVEELERTAREPWMVGLLCPPHMDRMNLDHPSLYPLWAACQDLDVPLCIHAGCGRPPYALGTEESSENLFMMHAMAHPFEQMRAMAALMGGGVLDLFPKLRVGFLESGVGWVPWWLDRLEEHAEKLPGHVPLMKHEPMEYVMRGQCYFSCEVDEPMLAPVAAQIGHDKVLYASDYPHWDCSFPGSTTALAERTDLDEEAKRSILGANALRLYTRIG